MTGATIFTADLPIPRLAHARLVLSPHASARIRSIDLAAARSAPGVLTAVGGADLPSLHAAEQDQPLARGRVIYAGQPVVAVVAETAAQAADAAALVEIEWEQLEAVVDPFQAMLPGAQRVLHQSEESMGDAGAHGVAGGEQASDVKPPNVSSMVRLESGDAHRALAAAEHVVEGTYHVPGVHQGFIETHIAAARAEPEGGFTIWTSTQGQFLTRRMTADMLGEPVSRLRVIPLEVGGGFGGKALLLEPLVCLLARLSRRPVVLELTRQEEFLMGRGGPGATVELKLGADAEGNLAGLWARAYFDNGAGPGGLGGFAGTFLGGTYRLPAFDFVGYDVCTNKCPVAAYRAPGGPQAFFALESAMDDLARKLGQDPLDFRLRNAVKEGDLKPDGSRWPRIGLIEVLERARRHPLYTAPAKPGEGVGVAVGGWGGGREPAAAGCRIESDGTLLLQLGSIDISGTNTALAMVAAETFGVELDQVRVETGDSANAPYAGMAGGSKIMYTVGPAVALAAADARKQLLEIAAEELEAAPEDLVISQGRVQVSGVPSRSKSIGELALLGAQFGGRYPPVMGQGRAAVTQQSPMFTVHIARVEVEPDTGGYRLCGYAAVQDVGRAINPPEVLGQIHGGALQGLGRALGEEVLYDPEGQLRTASFVDYGLPSIDQAPDFEVELVEIPSPHGPLGAKGVGEPPAVPGPAAVANAIRAAAGVRIRRLPIDTEQIATAARPD